MPYHVRWFRTENEGKEVSLGNVVGLVLLMTDVSKFLVLLENM